MSNKGHLVRRQGPKHTKNGCPRTTRTLQIRKSERTPMSKISHLFPHTYLIFIPSAPSRVSGGPLQRTFSIQKSLSWQV